MTSLVMLRTQNSDSLSDQIRGSEMKLDAKRSHILRNSVIAVLSAVVIVIAGLRIYSVAKAIGLENMDRLIAREPIYEAMVYV